MKFMKILPTILKSMFYQANWNMENMQGTGFTWLIKDLFKRNNLPLESASRKGMAEYFNTNPYLITFMLGMILKEAESGRKKDEYKATYASAFGALGDQFFWHSLRPFSFFLSLWIATYKPAFAMIFYLSVFNLFHFGFRFLGFYFGYHLGRDVIYIFRRIAFQKWGVFADTLSTLMAGATISFLVLEQYNGDYTLIFKAGSVFILGYFISRYIKAPVGLILFSTSIIMLLLVGV